MDPNIDFRLPEPKKLFQARTKTEIKQKYRKKQEEKQKQNEEKRQEQSQIKEEIKESEVQQNQIVQKLDASRKSDNLTNTQDKNVPRTATKNDNKHGDQEKQAAQKKTMAALGDQVTEQRMQWLNFIRNRVYPSYRPYNPSDEPKEKRINIQYDDKNFLNMKEANQIHQSYDDYGLADLVIAFPNPDFQTTPYGKEGVTFQTALSVFNQYLYVVNDDTFDEKQLRIERDMFLIGFLLLDDFRTKEDKEEERRLKREEEQKKQDEQLNLIENPQKPRQEKESKKKTKLMDLNDQIKELGIQLSDQQKSDVPQVQNIKEIKTYDDLQNQLKLIKDYEFKKESEPNQPQNILFDAFLNMNEADNTEMNLFKPLLQLRFQDKSIFRNVRKALSHGEFLTKLIYQEGKPASDGQPAIEEDSDWICTEGTPQDFLTLIRFTIMTKMTQRLKMHCRQFLSLDSKLIFMTIKAQEEILRHEAEVKRMNKQVEIGFADLLSLEPCDNVYRPLRLKQQIRGVVNEIKKNGIKKSETQKPLVEGEEQPRYQRVESRALQIAREAISFKTENELFLRIGEKQIQVDQIMDTITTKLIIDTSKEQVTIIQDDEDMGRHTWEAYLVYLEYIIDFQKRVLLLEKMADDERHQHLDAMIKEGRLKKKSPEYEILSQKPTFADDNLGFVYKLILRKALGDANEFYKAARGILGSDHTLQNLWDRLNIPCLSPYTDYFETDDEDLNVIWRQYQCNEKQYRSLFLNMQRIQLSASVIAKSIDMARLVKDKYMDGFFALHDQYQAFGESKASLFNDLRDSGLLVEKKFTPAHDKMKALFMSMEDEAEATDFDSECLADEARFQFCYPWFIPIDSLRDYFGEKIALYFQFLSYYTKQLSYMGLIGLIIQILQDNLSKEGFGTVTIIYSIFIVVWQTWFLEGWKREESLFAFRFGQTDFEDDETERPQFEGTYIRSIVSDEINQEYYSEAKRKCQVMFSFFVALVIIVIVVVLVLLLFVLKSYLRAEEILIGTPILNSDTIPSYLNTFQIMFFNFIYETLNDKLTNYENHQVSSTYENSLIAKVFLFSWVNTFVSCFIIAFLDSYFDNLDLCLYKKGEPSNCFMMLRQQITTIFVINFIKNIPEMIMPLIKAYMQKKGRKVDDKPVKHVFNQIDQFIMDQYDLEMYMTNAEVDGTAGDYMEMIIQFSFLILFGLSFPAVFLLAFINNIAELQVDKIKLLQHSRRPIPAGAANIGSFFLIMDIVSFISMFTNAGLISFTSGSVTKSQIEAFSVLLVMFLVLKYILRYAIPDEPEIVTLLKERHTTQINRLIMGFSKTNVKIYQSAPFVPHIQLVTYEQDFKQKNQQNLLSGPYLKDQLLQQIKRQKKQN